MIAEQILSAFKESIVPVYSEGVTKETNELVKFVNYVSVYGKSASPSKAYRAIKSFDMSEIAIKETYEYEKNKKFSAGGKLNITK